MNEADLLPFIELDVRPLIDRGEDPLDRILQALDRLAPGGSMILTSPFRPGPLIRLLEKRGYQLYPNELGPDHWQTMIHDSGETGRAAPPTPDPAMQGLSLDQAPPLAIPAGFFLTAPFAVMGAGALFVWTGATAVESGWLPTMLGLTHLATLGFLTMVMFGALYQMIPVVAGARVPLIRLAHLVYALLCVAVLRLVLGLTGLLGEFTFGSFAVAGLAIMLFIATGGLAVFRTRSRGATVNGMRLAFFSLLAMMLLGVTMARGFFDGVFPGERNLWIQVHLGTALLGWVGGLMTAVSWQIIPMFYLTPPIPRLIKTVIFTLTLFGVLLPLLVLADESIGFLRITGWEPVHAAATGALPAVLGIWLIHPAFVLVNLRNRKRKRVDSSLRFWQAGLGLAPVTAVTAIIACFAADPRWVLLFGWLAIWGWAGMIVHGMLSRILPFLVWFHRFAPHVGRIPVPAMRKMLPDARVKLGFGFHVASLFLGALAILTRDLWIARATGLMLLATGLNLMLWMTLLLRQRPGLSPGDKE